jgi:teichuronic acid biosynthesis glycosyltransferase TuaH
MTVAAAAAPHAPASPAGRDVILALAYSTWRTAVERGMCFSEDRLAQALLDDPRVRRLLVVETPRSLPIKLVKDALRPPPAFPDRDDAWLYGPTRLRRRDPVSPRALERTFGAWGRGVRREAQRRGLERPVLITTHPLVPGFAALDWVDSLTYYVYDDWASSPPLRRWWPAYEEAYARVSERGDRVVAVSQAIVDKVRPSGPHAVIPNGVDPDEWRFTPPPPDWFAALPGPRALYVGGLDARIDIEQLRRAARARRSASFVLVGPLLRPEHFEALRAEPNVHLHPEVGRRELVGLVCAADLCLLPHLSNSLTRAMSPLKLYEYLAGGAPVAALDLPPIRGISERVVIADELADAVDGALALGRASEAARRRFAEENSWARRQERVIDLALAPSP